MKRLFRRLKAPTPLAFRVAQLFLAQGALACGAVLAGVDGLSNPVKIILHIVGALMTASAAACQLATHPDQPTPLPND